MVIVLIASAVVVLFALHTESDASSAQIIDSGQCGPDATYIIYAGTLEITGSGEMYQYDSASAPWSWCENHYNITKIIIGDNITKLGAWSFIYSKQVKELTIPITLNSVVSDSHSAFAGCSHIEKISFTSGNGGYGYNYAAYEGSGSWYQNTPWYQSRDTLKEIYFADGVKGIGSDAFRELNITSIVLPDCVVHLGNHCFFNCTKLTDLTIPVSLNSYGSDATYPAFRGCTAIEKVTFTNGNGVPFDYMNWHKPYLTEITPWNMYPDVPKTIIIPDSVTKLGAFMFKDCNLKELTIPMSIDLIYGNDTWSSSDLYPFKGTYANLEKVTLTKGTGASYDIKQLYVKCCPWNSASNLKTVIIGEGVTRIGFDTFYQRNIENLVLPNTLTSFGSCAFYECTIKNLTIPITINATWLDSGITSDPAFTDVSGIENIVFTPGSSGCGYNYSAYDGNDCWYQNTPWYQCRSTLKSIMLEKGIVSIGTDAFRDLNITSIVIPETVWHLSSHAFYNCSSLTELTIPIGLDSVASAEYPAFDRCNLEVVNFTSGYMGVGFDYSDGYYPPWANVNGTSVTKMTFDSNIHHAGDGTFYGYTFYGSSGAIDPYGWRTLRGMTFEGSDGLMYEVQNGTDSTTTTEPDTADADTLWSDYIVCGDGVIEAHRICHQLPNLQESLKYAIRVLESGAGAA